MHARSTSRPLATIAAVAFLVVTLAACGKDSKTSSSSSTTEAKSGDAASTVVAKNTAYAPTTLTVKAGADVYFSNQDSFDHTMTADDGSSFDTQHVAGGATKEFTAPKAGTYAFHCEIHSNMKGVLTVE